MGSVRRPNSSQYVRYLVLNVAVSALTVTVVLLLWGRRPRPIALAPTPTIDVGALIASKVPTPTPTLPPTPTPHTYTVRSGDTIFSIARDLDIDPDALLAANGLTDPDRLSVGQVLTIPEVSEATPGTGPTPAAPSPPTQTPPPADSEAPHLEIRGVDGAGVLDTEAISLVNSGGQADMKGWTLDDGQGQVFRFPEGFTLYRGGKVYLHTKAGTMTVIDLYWGLPTPLWTSGKTMSLRDASGAIQSTFTIP